MLVVQWIVIYGIQTKPILFLVRKNHVISQWNRLARPRKEATTILEGSP
jgi:hypothetical protein